MKPIGLIGTAHIHTPGFLGQMKERGVPLAGLWDHDAERAARNSEKTGAPAMELDDLINHPEVGGFVICSETNLHLELVEKAAPRGLPMFVEKPLSASPADSAKMAEIMAQHGVIFQTGYFMRGVNTVQTLKRLLAEEAFGQVTRVRMSNCHSGALGGWFDGEWRWMADPKQAGVGAYGDLGTHVIDLLLWLFGPAESVTAALSMGTARYEGCDELGEGLFKMKSGVIATLAAGWDDVVNPYMIQVSGTKGHAMLGNTLQVAGADGKLAEVELDPAVPSGFGAFLDVIEGKSADLVSLSEAVERDSVMEALYRGAASNSWVTPA
jgi:predicted dehydrogenase